MRPGGQREAVGEQERLECALVCPADVAQRAVVAVGENAAGTPPSPGTLIAPSLWVRNSCVGAIGF